MPNLKHLLCLMITASIHRPFSCSVSLREHLKVAGVLTSSEPGDSTLRAKNLAQKLSLPLILSSQDSHDGPSLSWNSQNCLQILWNLDSKTKMKPFFIEFSDPKLERRRENAKSELICKAVGKLTNSHSVVWDFTAGLGIDSILLLSAGWKVYMFERNPIIGALLEDALIRFKSKEIELGSNINLLQLDPTSLIINNTLNDFNILSPNVIYLDPMYTPSFIGRKSKVNKGMQLLHEIIGMEECLDENNNQKLFDTALSMTTSRVVVKRPLRSPPLASAIPHETLRGSTQRFDIYFKGRNIIR